jgi:hypothetical protein
VGHQTWGLRGFLPRHGRERQVMLAGTVWPPASPVQRSTSYGAARRGGARTPRAPRKEDWRNRGLRGSRCGRLRAGRRGPGNPRVSDPIRTEQEDDEAEADLTVHPINESVIRRGVVRYFNG